VAPTGPATPPAFSSTFPGPLPLPATRDPGGDRHRGADQRARPGPDAGQYPGRHADPRRRACRGRRPRRPDGVHRPGRLHAGRPPGNQVRPDALQRLELGSGRVAPRLPR
jgi:hypothetical protein